jgi:saccharopine dehydrogenase-like NADP-dependent oxidoreductase
MRVGVLGAGAVGMRAVRQLGATARVTEVLVADADRVKAGRVADALAPRVRAVSAQPEELADVDVIVMATPAPHAEVAEELLRAGVAVVSVSDDLDDVGALLRLDGLARERGLALVVGAGFAPGMTCLLARFVAEGLDTVDEIHVAKHGAGGPACARQHHRALASTAIGWQDQVWIERPGGSGRELCWFPEPVGARDCYRAEVPDPLLLVPAFPGVARVTSRISATRRDRLTARLPMLRPPHAEGLLGAVRVEVRGTRDGVRALEVVGAIDRPAAAAGAVAAVAAVMIVGSGTRPGAFGLAGADLDAGAILAELAHRGVKAARYVGEASASW